MALKEKIGNYAPPVAFCTFFFFVNYIIQNLGMRHTFLLSIARNGQTGSDERALTLTW